MSSDAAQATTIDGRQLTQEISDRLHFLKNRPSPPEINGEPITYPPYTYQPYPAALYGPWTPERKRNELIQVARLNQLDLTKPLEREKAEFLVYEWDTRIVRNEREHQEWKNHGWADSPDGVKAAQEKWLDAIALQAAHRAHDDLHLSPAAKAEFAIADAANGGDHLLDLPVPKKRGRPKKVNTPAA